MELIQGGLSAAFNTLLNRHISKFYATAFRIVNDKGIAEDLVQDAFLKLWQDPWKWQADKKTKFTTWFYRVITNLALDYKRKRPIYQIPEEYDSVAKESNLDVKMDNEKRSVLITQWLEELPERQRLALNLSYYEDLSLKEIADILDISYKAVESLLGRARQGLKDKIKNIEVLR